MKDFIFRWAITTVAVMVVSNVISGIGYDSKLALIEAALLLGILNAFLRPILLLLAMPLIILSPGNFYLRGECDHAPARKPPSARLPRRQFRQRLLGFDPDQHHQLDIERVFRGSDGRVYPLTHHTRMKRVSGSGGREQ